MNTSLLCTESRTINGTVNTVTLVRDTKFEIISVFQGQEIVAEQSLDLAAKEGHWVILQVNLKGVAILLKPLVSGEHNNLFVPLS